MSTAKLAMRSTHRPKRAAFVVILAGAMLLAGAGCGQGENGNDHAAASTGPSAASVQTVAATSQQPAPAQSQPSDDGNNRGLPNIRLVPEQGSTIPARIEPPFFNLGYLSAGEQAVKDVQLRNTSDEPLTIQEVKSSCKCTTVNNMKGMVVPPGGSVPITVIYDAPDQTGPKRQNVWVFIDGYEDDYFEIPVEAEVTLPIRATPGYLRYESTSESETGTVTVESINGSSFKVISVDGKRPVYADDFVDGSEPRSRYKLQWDLSPYTNPCRDMPWWLFIETDHPACPILDVQIRHKCIQVSTFMGGIFRRDANQWKIEPLRVLAGVSPVGGSARVEVPTERLGGLELVSAIPRSKSIKDVKVVSQVESGFEKSYQIEVTPADNVRGLYYGIVLLYASDQSAAPVWVVGTVR